MDHDALGSLFELSRDAVVGVADNKICFANPTAGSLFGLYAGADASGVFPPELFDGVSRAAVTLNVNGRFAVLSVRKVEGVTLCCMHPSEEADNAEQSAGPMQLKGMSDALMSIRMALDALFKHISPDSDPRTAGYASVLYRSYYRLRRLYNHISTADNLRDNALSFSPALVNLEKLLCELTDSVSALAEPLGVHFRFSGEAADYLTMADRDLLELMLLNLLSNSLSHCAPGCHIAIHLRRSGDSYIVSVDDDGSGMSDSALLHAFHGQEPPEMTNALSGCGYGLKIAKGIAEKHGGALVIDTSSGQGCRVRISLPCKKPEKTMLRSKGPAYEAHDMNRILTELSIVLPTSVYQEQFFD